MNSIFNHKNSKKKKAETPEPQRTFKNTEIECIFNMMNGISEFAGLESTIDNIFNNISNTVGNSNLILYYQINDTYIYTDVLGRKETISKIDDPIVIDVLGNHKPIEIEHTSDTFLWAFPLTVGSETIGVFVIDGIPVELKNLFFLFPLFFFHVALILKNEIFENTKIKRANEQLQKEIGLRKQAEKELSERSLTILIIPDTVEVDTSECFSSVFVNQLSITALSSRFCIQYPKHKYECDSDPCQNAVQQHTSRLYFAPSHIAEQYPQACLK